MKNYYLNLFNNNNNKKKKQLPCDQNDQNDQSDECIVLDCLEGHNW